MDEFLANHAEAFHPARNARVVLQHWQLMRQYKLLSDQTPAQSGELRVSFSGENFCFVHHFLIKTGVKIRLFFGRLILKLNRYST